MGLIVQKYGGSSVADAELLGGVADRVRQTRQEGHQVVVVVSAMGGSTDELLALAGRLSGDPVHRELDALVSTGESVSAAALAIALDHRGVPAESMSGERAGIVTDGRHGNARIVHVDPGRMRQLLDRGIVPVVAGFQGESCADGSRTTLGRGGSDTTAVAVAAALGADVCEICTDVNGVYTADPRFVTGARKLDVLSYEEMIELSAAGAKVLALSSMEYARRHQVPVHLRSSTRSDVAGTWVGPSTRPSAHAGLPPAPGQPPVTGVAHQSGLVRCTVSDVTQQGAAVIGATLGETAARVDMFRYGWTDLARDRRSLSFVIPEADLAKVSSSLSTVDTSRSVGEWRWTPPLGKLSVVGLGIGDHPEILPSVLDVLGSLDVTVGEVVVCPARISVLCEQERLSDAVVAVHEQFIATEVEATPDHVPSYWQGE